MSGEKCSHQNISLRKNPKKDCSSDGSVVVVDVVLVVVDVVVVVVVIWLFVNVWRKMLSEEKSKKRL